MRSVSGPQNINVYWILTKIQSPMTIVVQIQDKQVESIRIRKNHSYTDMTNLTTDGIFVSFDHLCQRGSKGMKSGKYLRRWPNGHLRHRRLSTFSISRSMWFKECAKSSITSAGKWTHRRNIAAILPYIL